MASASMTTPEDGAEGAGVSPDSSVSAASLGANHFLQKAEHFSRMSITIDCGRLEPSSYTHSGLKLLSSKPNLYVEMTVDEKPSSRKTEFCRSSYQPRWHAQFAVPVTPYSQINFKLWDHSSFKRDPLVAFGELGMYHVLLQHEGKIQSRTVSVDLYVAQNNSSSSHCNGVQPSGESAVPIRTGDTVTASPSSTSTQEMKRCGELIVILDGMNVDMSSLPSPSPKPSINNNTSDRGVLPAGNGSVPSADGSASSQSSSRRRLSQELGSRVSAMSLSGPQDPKRNSTSSQPGDSARFPPLSRSGSSTNSGASSQTASMSGSSQTPTLPALPLMSGNVENTDATSDKMVQRRRTILPPIEIGSSGGSNTNGSLRLTNGAPSESPADQQGATATSSQANPKANSSTGCGSTTQAPPFF